MTVRDLLCDAREYVSAGRSGRECPPCGRGEFTSIVAVVVVVGPRGPLLGICSTGITTSRGFELVLLGGGMGMDVKRLLGLSRKLQEEVKGYLMDL
jgi:hypothetical protein